MAEGGREETVLAEGEDREEQENELIALEAIFGNEDMEISKHNNPHGHLPGGTFNIPIVTPENFHVKITRDLKMIRMLALSSIRSRGTKEKLLFQKANQRLAEAQEHEDHTDLAAGEETQAGFRSQTGEKLYLLKRLPPITLSFAYPHDYPTAGVPDFTLSCCWLEKKLLTKLCEKLDEIWTQYKGTPVIAMWHDFLSNDVLTFLRIKSPYDLGRVLIHIFTHPKNCMSRMGLHSKPFDERGIQSFTNLDDVLRKVLDFNLVTCDVCFEEKAGVNVLRLVNCDQHVQCKSCMRGWVESLIKDGTVSDMKCPGYKCDKTLLPTEVASLVSEDLYQRYDKLLLKTAFDFMPDVMNCPRSFCQFPVVLEDNLGLCPKCSHAFCGRCQNTYHGHTPCKLKSEMFSMLCQEYESSSAERKLELEMRYGKQVIQRAMDETKSNQWLESNSKQCPCCSTYIQKNDGCNKMTCSNCRTFFCWLCQQELSKSNPYAHYQHPTSPCSDRLFEGVELQNEEDLLIDLLVEELEDVEEDNNDDDDNIDID